MNEPTEEAAMSAGESPAAASYAEALRGVVEAVGSNEAEEGRQRLLAMMEELGNQLSEGVGLAAVMGGVLAAGSQALSGAAGVQQGGATGDAGRDPARPHAHRRHRKGDGGDGKDGGGPKGGGGEGADPTPKAGAGGNAVSGKKRGGKDGGAAEETRKALRVLEEASDKVMGPRDSARAGGEHGGRENPHHAEDEVKKRDAAGDEEWNREFHRLQRNVGMKGVAAEPNGTGQSAKEARDPGTAAPAGRAADGAGATNVAAAMKELNGSVQAMHHDLVQEIRRLPHGQDGTRFS